MQRDLLIVGQGLAGTLLGWELERAGVAFTIADLGHVHAASRVAAGILNPVTGQRIVKSWRVDALRPVARQTYRELEHALGVPLWRELRVRRFFVDDRERRVWADKKARGDLGEYAGASDREGFWIEGAARVDTAALIAAARARWLRAGVLREERVDWTRAGADYGLVIDCTGAGLPAPSGAETGGPFAEAPWQFSKGECLALEIDGLAHDVVLNRRHWLLPEAAGRAKVGATHEPGRRDTAATAEARAELEASVAAMTRERFAVVAQEAGVRCYLPDKRPVAGRHPGNPRFGVLNGFGAKGALVAPWLARQWAKHLTDGTPFDSEVEAARLWK
jgi:glycine/D-amino acid oxidase-like deaminating enzyme